MAMLKLSPPWIEFYHKVDTLFKEDSEVRVLYDDENKDLKLYVEDAEKADALTQLLPTEKDFGGVKLTIGVVSANKLGHSTLNLFQKAFKENPAVSYIRRVTGMFGFDFSYVVFMPKVVQYYTDSLNDINGMHSTLYQEIAKDVFEDVTGVFFCTDIVENLGRPLGEWP